MRCRFEISSQAVLLFTCASLLSCDGSTTISLSELDQSCENDSDCMLTNSDACSSCGVYSINKQSAAEAREQRESLRYLCSPQKKKLCIFEEERPVCIDNRCAKVPVDGGA